MRGRGSPRQPFCQSAPIAFSSGLSAQMPSIETVGPMPRFSIKVKKHTFHSSTVASAGDFGNEQPVVPLPRAGVLNVIVGDQGPRLLESNARTCQNTCLLTGRSSGASTPVRPPPFSGIVADAF